MYAHPSFIRDKPEALLYLQKTTSKNKHDFISNSASHLTPRSVSPSFSRTFDDTHEALTVTTTTVYTRSIAIPINTTCCLTSAQSILRAAPVSPPSRRAVTTFSDSDASSTGSNDRGKLDLLAFALEQEIACYN
jgi:hypothetical protein